MKKWQALRGRFSRTAAVRRWLALVLGMGMLTGAVRGELQFDVFLGLNGCMRELAWFPVVCEINNDAASFQGVIEIQPVFQPATDTRRLVVELPSGTIKRVTIPVFAPQRGMQRWNIRLYDEQGKVRASHLEVGPRGAYGPESVLVGSLARSGAGAPLPRAVPAHSRVQVVVTEVQTAVFPDNALALQAMSSCYLNSQRAGELKPPQVAALLRWVRGGGRLIVGLENEADVAMAPWLAQCLPAVPAGQTILENHPEVQQWLTLPEWPDGAYLAGGFDPDRPQKGENPFAALGRDIAFENAPLPVNAVRELRGKVVLGSGNVPLVVSGRQGKGEVVVLLFSPEREPVKSWKNLPVFWARLLEVPASAYASGTQSSSTFWNSDALFKAMIETRQVRKMPIGLLMVLLVVYLAVIGPLDRLWLKRLNRPMLTWITFPGYVVAFSVLIYLIGYKLRAGDSEYSELHVVDAVAVGNAVELHGQTYACLYSPATQSYPLVATNRLAGLRWSSGGAKEETEVMQLGDGFMAEVSVPVWSSRLVVNEWKSVGVSPLAGRIEGNGKGWRVTVENRSSREMKVVEVALAGRIFPLGAIHAGQTVRTNLDDRQGVTLEAHLRSFGRSFEETARSASRTFGGGRQDVLEENPDAVIACSFLSKLAVSGKYSPRFVSMPGLDLSASVEAGSQAVLFAWEEGAGAAAQMNRFKFARGRKNTLWRQIVEIERPAVSAAQAASTNANQR